jgi:N-acetylglucosamine repressor
MIEHTSKRALGPAFADCHIIRARGSKRQGAVAGIIQHLIDSIVPGAPGRSPGLICQAP